MFEIKKGVPMPGTVKGVKKYEFGSMAVGDFFFVPTTNVQRTQNSLRSSARKYRREGKKFSMPEFTYEGVRGVGVWRTK